MIHADHTAPDAALIDALARDALSALPGIFRERCGALAVHVEEFPEDDLLDELGAEDPFSITAVYTGAGLSGEHPDGATEPDSVTFFRRPILEEWCERGNVTLGELVRHILVHEIAHHFGMTDAQIAAIDDWTA